MNIQFLDSWLREHLDTKATPQELAKYLSLSGPLIERVEKKGKDFLYDIEITTNRVDTMSVRGVAREAQTILPLFGIKAKLKPLKVTSPKAVRGGETFKVVNNKKLVKRSIAVVLEDIKNWDTPKWMKERLEASGIRSLDAVIDITNYVMMETGHPSHVFDYDKIPNKKIVIREAKQGEKIVGLDDKTYVLPGGDIVFDDGDGVIIDLPGILGTKNSVVNKKTKRILFFLDNNDPVRIRKTSMSLGIRTNAATLNEKGVDPELAQTALLRGIKLYNTICKAKVASKVFDFYPVKPKKHSVILQHDLVEKLLDIKLSKTKVGKILKDLGFEVSWSGNSLKATPPSARLADVKIPEDIIEEIARIYGYHNLPSKVMEGTIPKRYFDDELSFEKRLKNILKNLGGIEIYTLSLVPKSFTSKKRVEIKNPLGRETKYLRTSLKPSLEAALKENKSWNNRLHIFEYAKTYRQVKGQLPNEDFYIAGIIKDYKFPEAKGIVEELLNSLHITFEKKLSKSKVVYSAKNKNFGWLEASDKYIYYQFKVDALQLHAKEYSSFSELPRFPSQIEDITVEIPKTKLTGDIVEGIKSVSELITNIELVDTFKRSFTFRIHYTHPEKTLTDKEITKLRKKIEKRINK